MDIPEIIICPVCNLERKRLTKHGVCSACAIKRGILGQFDQATQERMNAVVELGIDKPQPANGRRKSNHKRRGKA